jgi:C-terminal four TMM region of protein-O-mannosyltransferase/Dolichyl-phosphate-mannose-protein mannosyltransferase
VTGPVSGGTERGTGAPTRPTGTQGAVGAILIVLALGLALRVIIAYLLPESGFKVDRDAFQFWANDLATNGPWGFYARDFFHDYTPGYLYVLWLVGMVGKAVGGIGDLIKVPPILADLAIGWLVYSMVLELGGRRRFALLGAFIAVMNPVSWFDSVAWGQVDSFGVVFLLLGLRAMWRDQPERAAIFTVIAAIIKPQLGILVPLVAVVTIRRALWPDGGEGDPTRTGHPLRILTTGIAGFATAVVLSLPFALSPLGLVDQLLQTGGGYPYLTVNAYNPWAIVAGDTGNSLATTGLWVCDAALDAARCSFGTSLFGSVPAIAIGTGLLVIAFLSVLALVARRPDRLTILLGLAVLSLAFFVLPTRVHERYGFPFFALGAILAAISWRWRIAYAVLGVATFLNMYVVLTTLYPGNPSIVDWLGIGRAISSQPGIVTIVILHTTGFVWAFLQLRSAPSDRLADELEVASVDPWPDGSDELDPGIVDDPPIGWRAIPEGASMGGSDARAGRLPAALPLADAWPAAALAPAAAAAAPSAVVALPTWTPRATVGEIGVVEWLRERWSDRPTRPDRSGSLLAEGGGRLDRLDLWLLVVMVIVSMTLRTFRLAEPYQMHFDEVYHARTATEFLQDWRYGQSHDIYEWTHPHLAKYAMALGIMAWGEDDVSASSELGAPVRAAVVEPRRDDADAPGDRAGERLYISTGTELRVYDLRSRAPVATLPNLDGLAALALDPETDELFLGFDDGRIATLDPTVIGLPGLTTELTDLVRVDDAIDALFLTGDGTSVVTRSGDHLEIRDRTDGSLVGGADLPGLADIADGGTGSSLVATPAEVTDPAAAASLLAELLGADAGDFETTLATDAATVVVDDAGTGDTRTKLEAAIEDGRLTGFAITDVTRLATATSQGLTFVDATDGSIISTLAMTGGAHGFGATVFDGTKLYVTSGTLAKPEYHVVAIAGKDAEGGPSDRGTHPMPGLGSRVVYDPASQMIHILGLAPGVTDPDGPWTVYVVEPHANAVYADARLPADFVPAAWAADIDAEYPTDDRQQLLVFDGDGSTASVELGSHAFSWRLPGVIAGTLMLVALYLLTRILFRRRLVAGLVALFVLVDGMTFVQSRIGMNDAYVGLFIVAAYALFAAIWTGWWRSRWAFWLGLPLVGVLLGLALASKWPALYAIGGVGLLILARSALGRCVVILGLIGVTSVLGYMAISVPADTPGLGNLSFLLVMVALTLVAVLVAIFHPIAWTDDEMRFAIIVPAALGGLVFFGALATHRLETTYALGSIALTPLTVAFACGLGAVAVAVLFILAGRFGFGPLAAAPGPADPARLLPPPAPAPEGWLRPGWLLGLPVIWAGISLLAIPLAVYVASYIPWAMVENHRIIAGFPANHDGQTLIDLTRQMYGYHNGLVSPHPASSPWWAWPLDLKPVWFYAESLAGGTTAALYDAGNLVIWWMGIPAMLFVSAMAFRRRSLALALIAIGFACQWIPWARIDRAAFQYHYYTALPFVIAALAYFIAELWHGASRATWQLARVAGAAIVVLPAALWLFSRPLCAIVGVESVNAGSQACPAVIPDFVLTARAAALAVVTLVGVLVVIRTVLELTADDGRATSGRWGWTRQLLVAGAVVAAGLLFTAAIPNVELLRLTKIPVEPIVLIVAFPLVYLAMAVIGGRDPRRYVVAYVSAAVGWFVVLYPNIAALPLPSAIHNAYQGILPTYLYAFQFSVSRIDRNDPTPLLTPFMALLLVAVTVTCLVVAYSAWVWRVSLVEADSDAPGETDDLVRSGGA